MSDKFDKEQPVSEYNPAAIETQEAVEENKEYDHSLCAACQEHEREDGSFYCSDCRTQMLKTKIKGSAVCAAVFSVLFSFLAVVLFSVNLYQVLPFMAGEKQLKNGFANEAANNISKVEELSTKLNKTSISQTFSDVTNGQQLFPAGRAPNIFVAKVYAKAYSILQAGEYLLQMLGENTVNSDPAFISVKPYLDEYLSYIKTSEVVQGYLENITDPKKIPYDEILKKIDSNKGKEGISDHYLEYYKFYIALMSGQSLEEQNKYLVEMEKLSPENILMYGPALADNYYNLKQYDKAIEYADRMIERNKNNYNAHELKFMCYVAQNDFDKAEKVCSNIEKLNNIGGVQTGDYTEFALRAQLYRIKGEYDKALAVCKEGLKLSQGDEEIYRQQAIVELLMGDIDKAFKSAENAYKTASYNQTLDVRILNTVVLCAGLADEDELYEEAGGILTHSNYGINKNVLACINGEMSVKDVFSQTGGSEI